MEFTQAENIKLQRLQQAMSQAQEWLDNSEIDENEFADLAQQIQGRMGPLQQKKQQAEQAAKQAAYQEAMEQHAQMVAMEQRANEMKAQNFAQVVAKYQDPMDPTRIASFYPDRNGGWTEITFAGTEEKEAPGGEL